MCGIVAYVGHQHCESILLLALSQLEYRGYDSAGLATIQTNGKLWRMRAKGNISNLTSKLTAYKQLGHIGIAHTRWATHGEANEHNAHPHIDHEARLAVVQNGIIHNYLYLKSKLKHVHFESNTDTEVIPHLIAHYQREYHLDVLNAIQRTIDDLEGDFALAILSVDAPNELFVYSRNTPLIIAKGEDGYWCASDLVALTACHSYWRLPYQVLTKISSQQVDLLGHEIPKWHIMPSLDLNKQGYDSYMLKEIYEQPNIIAISARWQPPYALKAIKSIQIIAAGSSWHAALMAQYVLEKHARIPTRVWVASEYIAAKPPLSACSMTIAISQSGETADVLKAMQWENQRRKWQNRLYQGKLVAITNRKESTLAQYVNEIWPMNAGIEMAVAATKSFVSTVIMFYRLAGIQTSYLLSLVEAIQQVFQHDFKTMAARVAQFQQCIFMGKGLLWPIALEAALKLTEVANIASQAYAAGEMKHGYLALLCPETLVICLSCAEHQIQEVEARGAPVIRFDFAGDELHVSILTLISLQLLSYYVAQIKSLDVDRPRHLAKSVTVY
uniref:glutamine--fructose-6-phosphate transaminase (isomerizing) n=1 Tax=Cyanidiococcus yangmingshanensis TaxID=2690220 RepID=A0A7G5VUY3_9RHOD|nr:glucosamine-fructose-6-phosphate aminotransferase [Cyanidiococcus yangmingshanensis]QMX77500.1 glucosamine-fructose-6-phosphate aminotransferase [Cyanidiococcus yangmingshanensis]UNJ15902.1 glucosamine-fructose-6-phosphate aminotransferase [Cyanidioschyzonaceae sp. 3]WDB00409.1 L-glutamine-D-fructose-6-phosphate [Cyanidiococcus yangmingshanensis]